jgi:hypothetical protein
LLDRAAAGALLARRVPGVQRDIDEHRAWVERFSSPVTVVAGAVNHAYLQANGVRGGTASYGYATRLLVGLARSRSGSLAGLTRDPLRDR